MTKYTNNNFSKSFEIARHGFMLAYKSQRNFKTHLKIAAVTLVLALLLSFDYVEFCLLFIAIGFVLTAEIFNSVIEFAFDAYYRNKYSKLVKMAKDMSAAGVLIATVTSIAIGSLLFLNRIFIG